MELGRNDPIGVAEEQNGGARRSTGRRRGATPASSQASGRRARACEGRLEQSSLSIQLPAERGNSRPRARKHSGANCDERSSAGDHIDPFRFTQGCLDYSTREGHWTDVSEIVPQLPPVVVPIFVPGDDDTFDFHGTGTAIAFEGRHFLATAAHVKDGNGKTDTLLVGQAPVPHSLRELPPVAVFTPIPANLTRKEDHLDLAVIPISIHPS
jgi:hypothetical protein